MQEANTHSRGKEDMLSISLYGEAGLKSEKYRQAADCIEPESFGTGVQRVVLGIMVERRAGRDERQALSWAQPQSGGGE